MVLRPSCGLVILVGLEAGKSDGHLRHVVVVHGEVLLSL